MSVLNRAATGLFSLALVTALLVGGHWIAGRKKRHVRAVPIRHVSRSAPVVSTMPDCKMPESPPASGPVSASRTATLLSDKGDGDLAPLALVGKSAGSRCDPRGFRTAKQRSDRSGSRVADASESSAPFLSSTDAFAGSHRCRSHSSGGSRVSINRRAAGLGADGSCSGTEFSRPQNHRARHSPIQVPKSAMRGTTRSRILAPKDVRELMRLRQELGRMPPSVVREPPSRGQSRATPLGGPQAAARPAIASEPIAPPADSPLPRSDAERETARTIATSLDTITGGPTDPLEQHRQRQHRRLQADRNRDGRGFDFVQRAARALSVPGSAWARPSST